MKEFSKEFQDYYQTDEWKEKSEKRKAIDHYMCAVCGSDECLQVHHRHYRSFGHENVEKDLITLCRKHHAEVHENKDYIIHGITAAALLLQIDNFDEFFAKFGIMNSEITKRAVDHWFHSMKRMLIPVPKHPGAIVIPFLDDVSMSEKDIHKFAEYLNVDYSELDNVSRKIYYAALEDGGYIEEMEQKT